MRKPLKTFTQPFAVLLTLLFLMSGAAHAQVDERVAIGAPSFGYWSPELHEMHIRVPLQIRPVGGDELFKPTGVFINGERARYAYWYFNGSTYDYADIRQAGGKKVEVFAAFAWRAGQKYTLRLTYSYAGKDGEGSIAATSPAQGGVWAPSDGANSAFLVREEAGIARRNEPVETQITVPTALFPKPAETVRATVMTRPGVFEEIPCQIYGVDYSLSKTADGTPQFVSFRAAVQLSVAPKGQTTVFLWNCPGTRPANAPPPVRLEGAALGGTVENQFYKIELDSESGQLLDWNDKRLGFTFDFLEKRDNPPKRHDMHYTPDVYRAGSAWSHVGDWKKPEAHELRGPIFCETIRLGEMPGAPELASRVTYRFYANRPEVRSSSAMRVVKDVDVLAFRNGGMIQSNDHFTHAAWPQQDGSIVRQPLAALVGNDTGSPPAGRMSWNTPWVAFYNAQTHRGLALVTTNLSYFNEGAQYPNQSNPMYYVSFYRGAFLYTIRALNINYSANIRSYVSPMRAGTTTYEETAMLPFTFAREDASQFQPVEALRREILNPLIVVP